MIYRLETQSEMKSNTCLPHLYSYPPAVFLLNACWVVLYGNNIAFFAWTEDETRIHIYDCKEQILSLIENHP